MHIESGENMELRNNKMSDNGGVTRGVCKIAESHTHIIDVVETSNIIKTVVAA